MIPATLAGSTAHAYVSGTNAAFTDIGHQIFSRVPVFLLYIIGITFLVLAMAFRSAVIAFKAALTTLVSALVGFGVLTFVVQKGDGLSLIGLDRTGPIESFVPPIAFAILFGLSMDYEVFLMSRIREEHVHGTETVQAVKDGIAGVGRVIVAAALIMASVFFSFLLSPGPGLQGVRAAARRRDPHRCAAHADDARARAADAACATARGGSRAGSTVRCPTSPSSRRASARRAHAGLRPRRPTRPPSSSS